MKKLFLSLIIIALLGTAYAGNDNAKENKTAAKATSGITLSGKIIDFSTGEALTGVEVKIKGSNVSTYSDLDGKFSFENLKPGEYDIIASFISYKKSLIENYNAESDSNIEIKLQED